MPPSLELDINFTNICTERCCTQAQAQADADANHDQESVAVGVSTEWKCDVNVNGRQADMYMSVSGQFYRRLEFPSKQS